METEIDNPVIKDDLGSKFLEAAALHDRGEDVPADLIGEQSETPEVETEDHPATVEELADPANKGRPRDEQGRFIKQKPDETAQTPEQKAVDAPKTAPDTVAAQEPSEFEKKKQERAAKERERQDRSWENLNREKEELARRRQEWEQREQAMRQSQQQRQTQQPREFSSQQLFEAKNDFRKTAREAFKRYQENGNEADLDIFNQNDQWADQAEQNAIQFFEMEERENQQAQIQQHQGVWIANMEKTIKGNPELAKADSPVSKELQDILKTHGQVLQMLPDGFDRGVELAQLRLDAKDAPTLRTQLATAKAEIDRLNGKLAPTPGGVTGPVSPKPFEEKTSEDQFATIMRGAARIDAGE